uniref:epithelial cell adhesion molecule-like isoform X2 n=1 Tax=Semicossyphus pulcher TaxID=241346 RepID=UPI0037E72E0C
MWIALVLAALAVGASSQSCSCGTMKWATCDGDPCTCTLLVGSNEAQTLNCKALIPKCFLMKAEMYQSTGGKPGDNDAIYNPDCENNGTFKAKQCNTEKCWCVNSAGVRRTDKGDKDLKCEKLVETNLVSFLLTHKPVDGGVDANKLKLDLMDAINKRYSNFSKDLKVDIKYYPEERQITINVKPREDNRPDLTDLGYYIERDLMIVDEDVCPSRTRCEQQLATHARQTNTHIQRERR